MSIRTRLGAFLLRLAARAAGMPTGTLLVAGWDESGPVSSAVDLIHTVLDCPSAPPGTAVYLYARTKE